MVVLLENVLVYLWPFDGILVGSGLVLSFDLSHKKAAPATSLDLCAACKFTVSLLFPRPYEDSSMYPSRSANLCSNDSPTSDSKSTTLVFLALICSTNPIQSNLTS